MLFLWFSILCSTSIYILFKLIDKYNVNLLSAIVVNYFVASLLGLTQNTSSLKLQSIFTSNWIILALIIGALFVGMFFLIGYSSQKAGIVVTSIATRMSMVIPILVSMLLFDEQINGLKILKITLAFIAVFLSVYRKPNKKETRFLLVLPFILFIGSGSVDALVKTAQHNLIPENETALFSGSLFLFSFIISAIAFVLLGKFKSIQWRSILLGGALGLVNYGSLFFLINALNKSGIDSSFIFGINNLSIVSLSLVAGLFFFKEKISRLNWSGVILSIICVLILI